MSDLVGTKIVGFLTQRLICFFLFQNESTDFYLWYNQSDTNFYVEDDESGVHNFENSIETATRIVNYCGTGLNALFTILLVLAMLMNSQNRRLPRMWLLMSVFVAHLVFCAYQIFVLQHQSYWMTFPWTYTSCTLIRCIGPCLDFVTSLSVALLACHVFLWTFNPNTEKGRRTLAFWIVAGLVAWVFGFVIIMALKAPFTEVLTLSGLSSRTICTTKRFIGGAVAILDLCISFALPYLFALPVACVSLGFIIWKKIKAKDDTPVQLEAFPKTSETKSENVGVSVVEYEDHTKEASRRIPTLWVVFNLLLIICGIALRLPERLSELGVISDDYSSDYLTTFMTFRLLRVVYYSFILLVSLALSEIREVLLGVYRNCKRMCHRA